MIGKLNARSAATHKAGDYGDGGGLRLIVSPAGKAKWVFRFSWQGKPKNMGLGSRDVLSLAEARDARDQARKLVAVGVNPLEARKSAKKAAAKRPTFGEMADTLIASKQPEWRNAKHKDQWVMTLETYCNSIRLKPVDEIDTADILGVLKPLWQRVPETAARLRGRIEHVIDAARALGHVSQNEANPARWRGHLDKLLPKRQKLTRGHHPAMPYAELPAFMSALRQRESISVLALEVTILCATRTSETLGARWSEIDLNNKIWTIPAIRMKAGKEHRVPLVGRALEIFKKLNDSKIGEYVFFSPRSKKNPSNSAEPLSNMSMEMVLRRMEIQNATVHGFRSSFRDWAGDNTYFPREVCEAALAHVVSGVEGDYRRQDALEKRRALMELWDSYCCAHGKNSQLVHSELDSQ